MGFSTPYLLNAPYAHLEMQIGWVYGPVCALAFLFVWFFVPECKGKTLEETDWLFKNHVPIRKFGKYQVPNLYSEHEAKVLEDNKTTIEEFQFESVKG